MADNTQTTEAPVFEDIEFTAPTPQDFTTIPEDDYILELIGFRTVEKPQQRMEYELENKRKKNKDLTLADIDPNQWEWLWRVVEGEFAGETLKDWTNATWHEKSTAGLYAAALAGLEMYDRNDMIARGFASTRSLLGQKMKATVVEKETKSGTFRNHINAPRRLPTARPRPAKGAQADSAPAVPYTELPKDIFEDANEPVARR